ncbi:hypothetical protein EON81_18970 [bacterium]|nr:MAG: hypothetical protein EON81_18970 [bacterium]
MRRFLPFLLVLAGCSRATVDAEVRADGSMHRTLTFGGSGPSMSDPDSGSKDTPAWEETFELPKGAGWTAKRQNDPFFNDPVYVASRDVPAGAAFEGDLTIRSEGGAKIATNSGKITARGDGTFEYVETLRWLGKRQQKEWNDPALRLRIKAALPAGTDTAGIDAVVKACGTAMVRALFGPGDPLLDLMLTHRELAARRLTAAIRKAVRPLVADDATAAAVASACLKSDRKDPSGPPINPPGGGSKEDSTKGGPASILYSLRFPGEVLETNGLKEEDGTIYWRFYSEAAAIEDVTLRAVYRPK